MMKKEINKSKSNIGKYLSIFKLFIIKGFSLGLKYILLLFMSSNILNAEEFGKFSLYLIIMNFIYLFIGFGIIDTGMYLLSKDEKDKRELCFATLSLVIICGICFSIIMIGVLGHYGYNGVYIISFLSFGYVLNLFVKKVSVGMGEKFNMYYFEFFTYLSTLLGIILWGKNVYSCIVLYASAMLIVSLIFIIRMKPKSHNYINNIKYLLRNIKSYGFKVQLSQFVAMGTYDLDKIMLEYSYGFASVGVYNLSLNLIMPIKVFSNSLSEIMFKDFSKNKKIKKEILYLNAIICFLVSIVFTVMGYFIVKYFYDSTYSEILRYILLLPVLGVLSALYVPVNNFFSAKGMAQEKFMNAIILAGCNIILNLVFIPKFGVIGAVLATIIALIINNVLFYYQYFKYIENLKIISNTKF